MGGTDQRDPGREAGVSFERRIVLDRRAAADGVRVDGPERRAGPRRLDERPRSAWPGAIAAALVGLIAAVGLQSTRATSDLAGPVDGGGATEAAGPADDRSLASVGALGASSAAARQLRVRADCERFFDEAQALTVAQADLDGGLVELWLVRAAWAEELLGAGELDAESAELLRDGLDRLRELGVVRAP